MKKIAFVLLIMFVMVLSIANTACDNDDETSTVQDTVQTDNNRQQDEIESGGAQVLPKKVSKIIRHISGVDTLYFSYNKDGSLQQVIVATKSDSYAYSCATNGNQVALINTYRTYVSKDTYFLEDGRASTIELEGGKSKCTNTYSEDGYLCERILDYCYRKITTKYTLSDGLIVNSIVKEDDDIKEYCFEYSEIKNNLNIDIFYLIGRESLNWSYYRMDIEVASLFGLFGNRYKYLPSRVTQDEGMTYTSYLYSFDGEYISKIYDDYKGYFYEFFFE